MGKIIEMPKPKQEELDRMEEVKFYLFTSKIRNLARGSGLDNEYVLLQPLIQITGCNDNLIEAAVQGINSISAKPHELEVAVTVKYMGYNYDFIESNIMYSTKYHDHLMNYIQNRQENLLLPKLPPDLTNEIILFNQKMLDKVTPIFEYLNHKLKYKVRNSWDS